MEQNTKKLVWFSILTIFLGTIASFLLYFFGWLSSITAFITMYIFISLYKRFCQKLPDKKTLTYSILVVNITHIIAIVFALFVTTAIANKISLADAFALVSTTFVSYVGMLVITILLTIGMSLLGCLSAYQYHKNVFKTNDLDFNQNQQEKENEQELNEQELNEQEQQNSDITQ